MNTPYMDVMGNGFMCSISESLVGFGGFNPGSHPPSRHGSGGNWPKKCLLYVRNHRYIKHLPHLPHRQLSFLIKKDMEDNIQHLFTELSKPDKLDASSTGVVLVNLRSLG